MTAQAAVLVSWGRGNGHITRLARIARAFRAHAWQTSFVSHDATVHLSMIGKISSDIDPLLYPQWAEEADPWTQWADEGFLRRSVEWDRANISSCRPGVVINDNRLSTVIACSIDHVPIVTLCQDNQLPGYRFVGEPEAPIWRDPLPAINAILEEHHLSPLDSDVRELFGRGRIAIPSSPLLEPVTVTTGLDVVHTGILANAVASVSGQRRSLLFYRTVGEVTAEFEAAFNDWEGSIYVATGDERRAKHLASQLGARYAVAPLWDLPSIGGELRTAIHHGGHGITSACLAHGISSVVLPGINPERTANGRRVERLGGAVVLAGDDAAGVRWGPAVDVTGERPSWRQIRDAVDHLTMTDSLIAPLATDAEVVEVLT